MLSGLKLPIINLSFACSQYVKTTSDSGNFKAFVLKIFSSSSNYSDKIVSNEHGRYFLETMFEEYFKPERDFLDHLLMKKERHYDQFFEKCTFDSKNEKKKRETQEAQNQNRSSLDEED